MSYSEVVHKYIHPLELYNYNVPNLLHICSCVGGLL